MVRPTPRPRKVYSQGPAPPPTRPLPIPFVGPGQCLRRQWGMGARRCQRRAGCGGSGLGSWGSRSPREGQVWACYVKAGTWQVSLTSTHARGVRARAAAGQLSTGLRGRACGFACSADPVCASTPQGREGGPPGSGCEGSKEPPLRARGGGDNGIWDFPGRPGSERMQPPEAGTPSLDLGLTGRCGPDTLTGPPPGPSASTSCLPFWRWSLWPKPQTACEWLRGAGAAAGPQQPWLG